MHAPAGRARHEQRGPEISFSVAALEQVHASADFSPQLHFAVAAQMHPWESLPQQVDGTAIFVVGRSVSNGDVG